MGRVTEARVLCSDLANQPDDDSNVRCSIVSRSMCVDGRLVLTLLLQIESHMCPQLLRIVVLPSFLASTFLKLIISFASDLSSSSIPLVSPSVKMYSVFACFLSGVTGIDKHISRTFE